MTKDEITLTLYATLGGLALLKEHFKNFDFLIGSYAKHQYDALSDAEHLAKQYLIELKEEQK